MDEENVDAQVGRLVADVVASQLFFSLEKLS
jgi:hypothetical protein